ncbi:MAG: hypothetical protein RL013_1468, partial [Bacteroidota bacterium]
MTTTLRVNIRDVNSKLLKELEDKAGPSARLEIT